MLKRKNDRQPPQRLEEECYPNDYWLDKEDGGEDISDLALSSKNAPRRSVLKRLRNHQKKIASQGKGQPQQQKAMEEEMERKKK